MDFEIALDQRIQIMRRNYARDAGTQGVTNEIENVVIFDQLRILGKHRTLIWSFDVFFQLRHAALAGELENVVQELQPFQVIVFRVLRTA